MKKNTFEMKVLVAAVLAVLGEHGVLQSLLLLLTFFRHDRVNGDQLKNVVRAVQDLHL